MIPLQIRIDRARSSRLQASRFIRRTKRLYVAVCRLAIMTDPTNDSLNRVAARMIAIGLFAPGSSLRAVRYAVLKICWNIETGRFTWHPWQPDNWMSWVRLHNIETGRFEFKTTERARA